MSRAAAIFTGWLALLGACATAGRRDEAPLPYDGRSYTWPSGMRVVVYVIPHRPEVVVAASYGSGSADDPPGKEGLAHLVEHLTFRARPGGGPTLWDRLGASGAEFDGRTSQEVTDFYAAGEPETLDTLLQVESDRLADPLAGVTEEEFQREREVVIQEIASRGDVASAGAQLEWLTARALPGSPYGRSASAASLRSLTLEDVRAFVKERLVPERAVLVVTGPLPADVVAGRARRTFGALAGNDAAPRSPDLSLPAAPNLEAPVAGDLEVRRAPVERPVLWVGWAVPSDVEHGGALPAAAVRYLEARVDGVLAGRDKDRVTSIELRAQHIDGATLTVARLGLREEGDARPLLDALRSELAFKAWGGSEDLVDKALLRERLVMDAQVRLEAFDPTDLSAWYRATGKADYLRALPGAVRTALEQPTDRWVSRYLRPDRLVAVAVVPGGAPRDEELPLVGAEFTDEGHHGDPAAETGPVGDPARAMRPPRLAPAQRRRLSNGLEVVVAPRPGFRVISAHVVVRTEPAGPLQRVFEVLALRAASCAKNPATVAGDRLEFGARAPTALTQDALQQVACRTRELSLDGLAFDRAREELAQTLERSPPGVHERAGQRLLEALYPGHPYAADVTPAKVRAFRASDAAAWLDRAVRPDRASLILAGDVEATDALWRSIDARFGRWKAKEDASVRPVAARTRDDGPLAPVGHRTVTVVDRPGWPSAEVIVGVRVPPRARRDEPAFRVLAWQLGDSLNARLRMGDALTYRVTRQVLEQSQGSALLLQAVADAASAGEVVNAMLAGLAALQEPLPEPALARARWHAVREAAHGLGTSWRNALRLQELFVYSLRPDEWDTFAARTAALDQDDLRAALDEWAVGREAVLLVGDADLLAPQVRLLGVEVEVVRGAPEKPPR